MRRRRRSVQDFVTETLKIKVSKLMNNRRRILAPFPIVPEKIYRAAWSEEERAALKICVRRESLLRMGQNLIVHMPSVFGDRSGVSSITIRLNQPLPMPGTNLLVPYQEIPVEQAYAIQEWAPLWLDLNNQQNQLISKMNEVGKVCKTWGQLYRLWPDILSFFDDTGARAVCNAKVKSPYPSAAMLFQGAESLRPEFRPEVFAPFTSMIAECLMLPENEEVERATIVFSPH